MIKKLEILTFLILFTIISLTLISCASATDFGLSGNMSYVNNENDFKIIQNAIDSTKEGSVVYLNESFYQSTGEQIIISKNITLDGFTKYHSNSTLDGNSKSIIVITNNAVVTLKNINFINSYAIRGSAIYNSGTVIIENCNFINCSARDQGGAIYTTATCIVHNSKFDKNNVINHSSTNDKSFEWVFGGAAIFNCNGNLEVNGCTFTNNLKDYNNGYLLYGTITTIGNTTIKNSTFKNNYGKWGGAISGLNSSLNIINCSFIGNVANYGGGILIYGSKFIINGCEFTNNTSLGIGTPTTGNCGADIYSIKFNGYSTSGMVIDSKFANATSETGGSLYLKDIDGVEIKNCEFTQCNANLGGALYLQANQPINITNSNFTSNNANKRGGAILVNSKVTIQRCEFNENKALNNGGDIEIELNGNCQISNSSFMNGNAYYGGSISVFGILNFTNSNIKNSKSKINGGGIFHQGTKLDIINSSFTDCVSKDRGGAIYSASGSSNIINSIFVNNKADWGGSILSESNIAITGSEFKGNNATTMGGAVMGYYSSKITISNSTFESNKAPNGGGVMNYKVPNFDIYNSTFISNNAEYSGGAIFNRDPTNVVNSKFIENNAITGGAIYSKSLASINKCVFMNNNAAKGSAILQEIATLDLSNSNISNVLDSGLGEIYIINNGKATFVKNNIDSKITPIFNENGTILSPVKLVIANGNITEAGVNNTLGLYATLTDDNGNRIGSTQGIKLNVNGTTLTTTFNSEKMVYECSFYPTEVKDYYITGSYSPVANLTVINDTLVVRVNYDISISANNTTYGEAVIVHGSLPKNVTGNVKISLSNGYSEEITPENGTINFVIENLDAGNYTLTVVYSRDNYYLTNSNTTTFNVKKANSTTSIVITDAEYGKKTKINITISGINETGPNGTANITINNITHEIRIINGKGIDEREGLNPGKYTIITFFKGNRNYNPSTNRIQFNVNKAKLNISINAENITYGEIETINIKLSANISGNLTIKLNNKSKIVEIKNGVSTINMDNLDAGNYDLLVEYEGNDYYVNATNKTKLNIAKADSIVLINIQNITYGQNITGNITLKGNNNTGMNGTVNIIIRDKTYRVNITNESMHFTFDSINAGNYIAYAVFEGNKNYKPSNNITEFIVSPVTTEISVKAQNVTYGEIEHIAISITPNISANISLQLNNGPMQIFAIKNGFEELELTNLNAGDYTVTVIYLGDINGAYLPSKANATFTIFKAISKVSVILENITYGDNITVHIATNANNGSAIVNINNKNYTVHLKNNKGVLFLNKTLPVGSYNATVVYLENNNYESSRNFTMFEIGKAIPEIEIVVNNATYGDDILINVTLINAKIDDYVTVSINEKEYVISIIDGMGSMIIKPNNYLARMISLSTYPLIVNEKLSTGHYLVKVNFEGNTNYDPLEVQTSFNIAKINTSMKLSVHKNGNDVEIIIKMPEKINGMVTVLVSDVKYTVNITNGTGFLKLRNLPYGTYKVIAQYPGNEDYTECVESITFTVNSEKSNTSNINRNISADLATGNPLILLMLTLLILPIRRMFK